MKQTIRQTLRLIFVVIGVLIAAPVISAEKTIVVLGDSIAAGYGVDPGEAFPAVLQSFVEEKNLPYTVVNAGLSGDTTAGGARRISWVLKRPVDVLIIELGGNDGLRGIPPETTRKNLETIIAKARDKNPDMKIVLTGMQIFQNMGIEYVEQFKLVYEQVSRDHEVKLVPFLLEGVGGIQEMNQEDQIHPNPQGHRRVAENVWKVLKPVLVDAEKSK